MRCSSKNLLGFFFEPRTEHQDMMDIPSDEDFFEEEVVTGGTYPPNSRVAKLEEEAFLDSLKQYKHVQPRIGKLSRSIL